MFRKQKEKINKQIIIRVALAEQYTALIDILESAQVLAENIHHFL